MSSSLSEVEFIALESSGGVGGATMGRCCTLATSCGFSISYCWTVWFGPRVKNVAVGP